MVFLIQRVDHDNTDSRNPLVLETLGYCQTRDEAIAYITDLRISRAVDGKAYYGYDRQVYPQFEVVTVPELVRKMDFGA